MNKLKLKKTGKEVKMGERLIKVVNLCGIPIPIAQVEINRLLKGRYNYQINWYKEEKYE